jgi:hypothetical protein
MIIHCIIFCWPGQEQNATNIAQNLVGQVERLTIINASESSLPPQSLCEIIKVDTTYFYGMKFYSALKIFDGDIFLQIQADAASNDWSELVKRCRHVFLSEDLGIWAPDVNYSYWETKLVQLADTGSNELKEVTQTDCIVWAMSCNVVDRMRKFDYQQNNLGWGIDWAAIAYCYANKLRVIRDTAIHIQHPQGTGYKQDEAAIQMKAFLNQLDSSEKTQYILIQNTIDLNREKMIPPKSLYESLLSITNRAKKKLKL